MLAWLNRNDHFPPVAQALVEPNGLLAAGADLSAARLLDAYRRGIFPWFNPGEPILWWSPDPRMVLFPDEFRVSRSLVRRLRRGDYALRVDSAFVAVMRACAAPRGGQRGTWIGDAMIAAYSLLHALGHAHSVEVWMAGEQGPELAGGLYGVALGGVFYGESMFSCRTDASKIALARLVEQLRRWGYGLIDCQMATAHLASLGAREIPRADFVAWLDRLTTLPGRPGTWTFDLDLVA
ncbi:MAG: leucyl/phenylalanyl-tRNA--protein transferase [Thiobacillaceae bacterium]|nr:leucyl/phenylalanyl-tRNA--protein transferase [Thiobacillaceae bacterium]